MVPGSAAWGRSLVMFVMAWLVGLYVYEVVREHSSAAFGLALAAATFVVSGYARYRAAKSADQPNLKFYFWLTLPMILFFLVPVVIKLVVYLRSTGAQPWWEHFMSLLPLVLKLGVPVVALFWVYLLLGKLDRPSKLGVDSPEPPAKRGTGL